MPTTAPHITSVKLQSSLIPRYFEVIIIIYLIVIIKFCYESFFWRVCVKSYYDYRFLNIWHILTISPILFKRNFFIFISKKNKCQLTFMFFLFLLFFKAYRGVLLLSVIEIKISGNFVINIFSTFVFYSGLKSRG